MEYNFGHFFIYLPNVVDGNLSSDKTILHSFF